MNYCEKQGDMIRKVESVEVKVPGHPCNKFFVDFCLNDLLRHATCDYFRVTHEYDREAGTEKAVLFYKPPYEYQGYSKDIPLEGVHGPLEIAYLVIKEALYGGPGK